MSEWLDEARREFWAMRLRDIMEPSSPLAFPPGAPWNEVRLGWVATLQCVLALVERDIRKDERQNCITILRRLEDEAYADPDLLPWTAVRKAWRALESSPSASGDPPDVSA